MRSTRAGTFGSVQYILRLPSGTEYVYSGWPDFQIYQKFSQEERQLYRPVGAEETVRAVGEVQSPPGMSSDVKNRTFAQAGIYTLGHFRNTTTLHKLATIILYKDLTAHVALATINRAAGKTDLVGEVTYKLVHCINSFNLRHTSDLMLFASVFISTLKSTLL